MSSSIPDINIFKTAKNRLAFNLLQIAKKYENAPCLTELCLDTEEIEITEDGLTASPEAIAKEIKKSFQSSQTGSIIISTPYIDPTMSEKDKALVAEQNEIFEKISSDPKALEAFLQDVDRHDNSIEIIEQIAVPAGTSTPEPTPKKKSLQKKNKFSGPACMTVGKLIKKKKTN